MWNSRNDTKSFLFGIVIGCIIYNFTSDEENPINQSEQLDTVSTDNETLSNSNIENTNTDITTENLQNEGVENTMENARIKLTADEEIAQDLVQETFLKLVMHIDKFDVKGKAMFSTYLMKIARNCYLDYLKKDKKMTSEIDIETISDTISIEDKIAEKNELDMVLKEIDTLPFEQAQAIKLKYLEEYSLKEIAEKMGTKPITIKSRIYEGKKKLEKRIKRGGNAYG